MCNFESCNSVMNLFFFNCCFVFCFFTAAELLRLRVFFPSGWRVAVEDFEKERDSSPKNR